MEAIAAVGTRPTGMLSFLCQINSFVCLGLDLSDMQSNVLNNTQTQWIFVAIFISVTKTGVTVRVKEGYIYSFLQS